jgi:hypothetical protein
MYRIATMCRVLEVSTSGVLRVVPAVTVAARANGRGTEFADARDS